MWINLRRKPRGLKIHKNSNEARFNYKFRSLKYNNDDSLLSLQKLLELDYAINLAVTSKNEQIVATISLTRTVISGCMSTHVLERKLIDTAVNVHVL